MVQISSDGKAVASLEGHAGAPSSARMMGRPTVKAASTLPPPGPGSQAPILGRVLHIKSADGTLRAAGRRLHYANGIALSPDGQRLYVNESEAGRVISFKVESDGTIVRPTAVRASYRRSKSRPRPIPTGLNSVRTAISTSGSTAQGGVHRGRQGWQAQAQDRSAVGHKRPISPSATDGKTIYVMAVDDTSAAPYKGKVYSVANE